MSRDTPRVTLSMKGWSRVGALISSSRAISDAAIPATYAVISPIAIPSPPSTPTQNGLSVVALLGIKACAAAVRPGTGTNRVAVLARFARNTPA